MKVSKPQRKVLKLLQRDGAIVRRQDYFYGQEAYCEHSKKVLLYFRKDTFEALLNMGALMPAEMSVSPKYFYLDPYFRFI